MKIEPEITKYLRGDAFKNTLPVEIGREKHKVITRENAIEDLVIDKNVIHVGCSDHIQIINDKIKIDKWLHGIISKAAKNCVGIDNNKESIEYIRTELGYNNVYFGDVLSDDFTFISEKKWDYAVFGELIEHLNNPVSFLEVFKEKYGSHIKKFIITVPNIYNKKQYQNMLNYKEVINSDHRFWFTPYTITKLLYSAGYLAERITYANLQNLNLYELVIKKAKSIARLKVSYPFYYFNTIIIIGHFN